jgi:pyruvate-ferredoxin/flavodoxin oxidoreductase
MIEGFIQGLKTRRPALFNIYSSCQPEHGIGDDMSNAQAKLAVESRAYPLFTYDPDRGKTAAECFDLDGNPSMDTDWPRYKLDYLEGGRQKSMELPMTFADFAVTEVRFRKHFRVAPQDTWNDSMVALDEFLTLSEDERQGRFPYVWSVDRKQQLTRLLVALPIVKSCEERRDFWTMLRGIAGVSTERLPSREEIAAEVRQDLVGKLAAGIMQLADGPGGVAGGVTQALAEVANAAPAAPGQAMAPWIDSEECTSCDECVKINPRIFEYDARKHAFVKDPTAGPYKDLVRAAERCTARVIHPGLPADRSEKDVDKLIARAQKYN